MKRPLFLFTLATLFTFASSSHAIMGGKPVASNDPIARSTVGIVMVSGEGQAICTGSLISSSMVLTAAHCAVGFQKAYIIFSTNIMVGAQSPLSVRPVVDRHVSPDYIAADLGISGASDHSDVAILKFSGGLPSGYVPAKLMSRQLAQLVLKDEARITLAGYGATDAFASEGSGVLRKVGTKIDKFYNSGLSVKVGTSMHGACHGDSGGPAIMNVEGQNYVFAVTSRASNAISASDCSGRAIYSLIF